jgi:hypothetical protein
MVQRCVDSWGKISFLLVTRDARNAVLTALRSVGAQPSVGRKYLGELALPRYDNSPKNWASGGKRFKVDRNRMPFLWLSGNFVSALTASV